MKSKRLLLWGSIGLLVVSVVVGIVVYFVVFDTENEASVDIEEKAEGNQLSLDDYFANSREESTEIPGETGVDLSTSVASENPNENDLALNTPAVTTPQVEVTPLSVDTEITVQPEVYLFRITSDESEVRFSLDEELRGEPVRVVGVTNQVGGDIIVNVTEPAASVIGDIVINLRTLETDQSARNRAIRSVILRSGEDQYEFTEFKNITLSGMPETVEVGVPFTFQATGELTLVDVTRSVTFEIEVTPISTERIEGYAAATVLRSDFGLEIPSVPAVANVSDAVLLEIDFVALQVDSSTGQ